MLTGASKNTARINEVQILRKFLFLDGSLICLHVRVHFGKKSGIVESVYGSLEMELIKKKKLKP